ncbi:MAG TPA: SDR family oxidoreductase [Acidimicrobiia bacterium]|jgi:NAD(P)-dependent dehydrogenase (short-subunit alcohol dehydrogenase family)
MPTAAVITGASRGLGRALAVALADEGWDLLIDARTETDLDEVVSQLRAVTNVWAVPGDVADPQHRADLAEAAAEVAPIGLLVNNASTLGPSPLPRLEDADVADFAEVLSVNVVSPLAIFQAIRPHLSLDAIVMNITSDAAVEPYEGWGLYGASKAALDHLSAVMAVEHPEYRVYALDPGDMRTEMHQRAFPGEDISDRPLPEEVVPQILEVIRRRPPSGRIVAPQLKVAS